MPSPDAVLMGLTAIANDWRWLAIAWHAFLTAFFMAVVAGWRPSTRILRCLLVAPLVSVSLVAWLSGNPFNGAVFAIVVAGLLTTVVRIPETTVRIAASVWGVPGAMIVVFGWTYPHFVGTDSSLTYLYASPFGTLPCPTLSVVIGLTLLFPDLRTRLWTTSLIGLGLLYGAIGVFRLGVALDWGLVLASATLTAASAADATGWRSARANRVERHRLLHGDSLIREPFGTRAAGRRRSQDGQRRGGLMSIAKHVPPVQGYVSPGFEPVREAFAENFARRHELGGACCVYVGGERVVDLWGGIRNEKTGEPWERESMVVVHSATKGLAAMTLALAHSRGWLDYEERVATYWPEFAQHGKQEITVRQLLAHQAGLFAFDEPVDRNVVADLDRLAAVMTRHKPAWAPGTRQAYHGLTLGFYEGELVRRVDPRHRTLGQFFQDEIATPLGEDFYIRLPEEIPNARLATLSPPGMIKMLIGFRPLRLLLEGLNRRSNISRALAVNPGTSIYLDDARVYARNLEVPAGGGVGTARAIAHAYSVFATDGRELGLRRETLDLLAAPAVPPTRGFYDECLKGEVQFSLGFMKPTDNWRFGGARSFGSPGTGGAFGFADPDAGIGYGYVTSRMGTVFTGDPRDVALRDALYSALLRSRQELQLAPERIAS